MANVNNLRRGRKNRGGQSNSGGEKNLMQIVDEIVNNRDLTISAVSVRRQMMALFGKNKAEGVEIGSFRLSLLDPLTRKRIKIPVQSTECDHFQCFDLYNFLEFSSKTGAANGEEPKNAWRCPHCQKEAKLEQLRVDGYFQEILLKVGPEPQEVEIFPDGHWKEVEQLDFKETSGDDDDVVEIVPKKKPKIQNGDLDRPPTTSFFDDEEKQWQSPSLTLNESIARFFLNDFAADVCFVPQRKASFDPPWKFPGHKLILMSRSSVLRSLFLSNDKNRDEGEENAQGGRIQVVEVQDDVEQANFEQFLRFCYTDHVDFTRENVAAIYQFAHHYDVPLLEKRAADFICDGICFGNAFEALDFACEHSEYRGADKIRRWALWTIRNETREALYKDRKDVDARRYTSVYNDGFLGIGREALRVFANHSDQLPLCDFEIFQALFHWARCRQRAAGFQAISLRETIGPALHAVKFSRMSLGEFARVMEQKVLTDAEAFQAFKRLSGAEDGSLFGEDPEGGPSSSGFVPKNKFDED